MPHTPLRELKPELFEDEQNSDTEVFAVESNNESEDEEAEIDGKGHLFSILHSLFPCLILIRFQSMSERYKFSTSKQKIVAYQKSYVILLISCHKSGLDSQEEVDDSVDLDNFDIDDVPLLQGNQCLLFEITMSGE